MDQPPLLFAASKIIFSFQEKTIFNELSITIRKGEHFAIAGPNGTGKSTLLSLISGNLRLSQISHTPVSHPLAPQTQAPQIQTARTQKDQAQSTEIPQPVAQVHVAKSQLPQPSQGQQERLSAPHNGTLHWHFSGVADPSLLGAKQHIRLVSPAQQTTYARQEWRNLTGQELVLSGFDNTPLYYGTATDTQIAAVTMLAHRANLEHLLKQTVHSMSQGQLRNTLLMRALIGKPALLLLDEPFDGLDTSARVVLFRLMKLADDEGSTLVVTAHKAEDLPEFITRLYTIEQGQLRPCSASCLPSAMSACTTPETPDAEDDELVELLQRQHSRTFLPMPDQTPVLQMEGVDVFIERNHVLHAINWQVNTGEHWIIKGRNGAGKSTLLRLAYGEEFVAYGGNLRWFGKDHIPLPDLHGIVGYVSDRLHQQYQHDISAEEVVCSGFYGTIGLYETISATERDIVRKWMHRFSLSHLADSPYNSLSTGEGKRVLLARALAKAPPVLLLDEPFSGLDPANRQQFLKILPLLAAAGTQILFVSHDLPEDNAGLFTHELLLVQGEIFYAGPVRHQEKNKPGTCR